MPNLRSMIDGHGSMQINVPYIPVDNNWKVQDDFMIRRKVNRSGPITSEVLVGKILAMHDDGQVEVSINKDRGLTQRAIVNINDLQPVSDSFKRQSSLYNSHHRPRV